MSKKPPQSGVFLRGSAVTAVLYVEDDLRLVPPIKRGLERLVPVAHVANLAEARKAVSSATYSAIIVDEHLPDGSGLDFLRALRRDAVQTPALLLTGDETPELASHAMLVDASFLRKPALPEALREFVRKSVLQSASARPFLESDVQAAVPDSGLTTRELDVLTRLVRGQSRDAIARAIDVSDQTLKGHTKAIKQKLGGSGDAADAALRVAGAIFEGRVLRAPDDED